ncbi:2653_t:CDS:2, partial [Cetraspora pellucida]
RPRTVVDKNGLIYMWFTPDKYSSIDNADENLYIFDSVKYSWSTVKPPMLIKEPNTAVILSDGRIIFTTNYYN